MSPEVELLWRVRDHLVRVGRLLDGEPPKAQVVCEVAYHQLLAVVRAGDGLGLPVPTDARVALPRPGHARRDRGGRPHPAGAGVSPYAASHPCPVQGVFPAPPATRRVPGPPAQALRLEPEVDHGLGPAVAHPQDVGAQGAAALPTLWRRGEGRPGHRGRSRDPREPGWRPMTTTTAPGCPFFACLSDADILSPESLAWTGPGAPAPRHRHSVWWFQLQTGAHSTIRP
jgi:hypothetical protein